MIRYYENEREFDDAFDRIEELNEEHLSLKENVEEAEQRIIDLEEELSGAREDLVYIRKALEDFEDENKEFLF